LEKGVPQRTDWPQAQQKSQKLLDKRGRGLLEGLGFQVAPTNQQYSVLKSGPKKIAVAIFLDRSEAYDLALERFGGATPIQYALNKAEEENLDYVVVDHGSSLRIHTTAGKGVGRRGRTETFVEAHLDLLPTDRVGYLWLLFSAAALAHDGTFTAILEASHDYASDVGSRLRDRIYKFVIPELAVAIANARNLKKPTAQDLKTTYEMALLVLFRLLFIAYAEDKDLLPYRTNERYRDRSLKKKARELATLRQQGMPTFDESGTHWDEVVRLFDVVNTGKPKEWGVPPYNGGMFSKEADVSPEGKVLADICLTNREFGPILCNLLVDPLTPEGPGPVDFRSLGVRNFGTIYEGLLESELSVAEEDLIVDAANLYVPAGKKEPDIRRGQIYLHDASGARKSTASYYTKDFAVDHLLDYALEPAITDHLARLDKLDERRAAEAFFDFRVADIAMGSGHFLVAAVDRIEHRFSSYLAKRPLNGVIAELSRLRQSALDGIEKAGGSTEGIEIDNDQLLRRQIARRCIYGVDINSIAVQLARLSLWIHTFVPGLPLSFLDHNIVCGNSLAGIGSFEEVSNFLKSGGRTPLFDHTADSLIGGAAGAVRRLGVLSDANAAEITEARHAFEEQKRAVAPTDRMFDIISAARLPDSEMNVVSEDFNTKNDLILRGLLKRAKEVLGALEPFHFPLAFPEVFLRDHPGFDVILGNPPWDKVRFEAQQFWVVRCPGLNTIPANRRDAEIEKLRRTRPHDAQIEEQEREFRERLQSAVDCSYNFQGRGHHGHHDLAKLFCERALCLLSQFGKLGYVIPRVALVLGGWTDLREQFLKRASLTTVQARNKAGWLFDDVHTQITICLMTRTPSTSVQEVGGVRIWPSVITKQQLQNVNEKNSLWIREEEIRELTDAWVIPWFSSPEDRPLFERLRAFPRLGSGKGWIRGTADSSRWDFSGSGPHSKFVKSKDPGHGWRALMTRHVLAYRIANETEFQRFIASPEKLVPLSLGVEIKRNKPVISGDHPTIIYRYPTMNDNTRTLIATVLPEEGYLYSKGYVHGVRAEDASPTSLLALLGLFNSFICDWWVRRFTDRHMTLPVLTNIPLPDWTEDVQFQVAGIVSCLLMRGGITRLPGGHKLSTDDSLKKCLESDLLARIENYVLKGFGIDWQHLATALTDFSDDACPESLRAALVQAIG
jgi:hypothetical protein